jgi:ankyrin repeat protein
MTSCHAQNQHLSRKRPTPRQALLEAGGNADKPNNIGDTPMTVAAAAGHAKIVLALVQAGADKNKVDA